MGPSRCRAYQSFLLDGTSMKVRIRIIATLLPAMAIGCSEASAPAPAEASKPAPLTSPPTNVGGTMKRPPKDITKFAAGAPSGIAP
jgi:hypothetical protein